MALVEYDPWKRFPSYWHDDFWALGKRFFDEEYWPVGTRHFREWQAEDLVRRSVDHANKAFEKARKDFFGRMSKYFDKVDAMDIVEDPDRVQLKLDVGHFDADEIKVTVSGHGPHWLEVEAKHEERKDKYGHVRQQFHRRYLLPDRTDVQRLTSRVRFGVLSIEAPRFPEQLKITDVTDSYKSAVRDVETVIPVQHEKSSWWKRERRIPITFK